MPYFFKTNCNLQTFTERWAAKDCVEYLARRLRGGRTHKWPEEFKQCCAQCDYLAFFHAGWSFRGHYHRILSVSHRQHTKKKQVGLCHFNDSIAFGVLYRLCSVTQQRPMWRAPAPPPWIRPHSDESRRGHLHPLTRRGCWRGLEDYFIGLFLQRHDLFVRIFHERGFKSQENISWKKKKKRKHKGTLCSAAVATVEKLAVRRRCLPEHMWFYHILKCTRTSYLLIKIPDVLQYTIILYRCTQPFWRLTHTHTCRRWAANTLP